jgi:hypothetical protein
VSWKFLRLEAGRLPERIQSVFRFRTPRSKRQASLQSQRENVRDIHIRGRAWALGIGRAPALIDLLLTLRLLTWLVLLLVALREKALQPETIAELSMIS